MNLAVVGTKFISDLFIQAAIRTGAYELCTICSRSAEKGQQYKERFGFRKAVQHVRETAEDPEVEIVYIATPNMLHYEHAKICLEHGKHVIIEKPSFMDAMQLEELLALAQAHDVFLFEAMRSAHNPDYELIKQHLPEIGKIHYAHFSLMRDFRPQMADNGGTPTPVFLPECAGGCNFHLGIYAINAALMLIGKPLGTHYEAVLMDTGVDASGVCMLRFEDCLCTAASSIISSADSVNFIKGEEGKIVFDYVVTPHTAHLEKNGKIMPIPLAADPEDMAYEAAAFAAIASAKDASAFRKLAEDMRTRMNILEDCRKQAGICFERRHP